MHVKCNKITAAVFISHQALSRNGGSLTTKNGSKLKEKQYKVFSKQCTN